jgi:hypothetical protein
MCDIARSWHYGIFSKGPTDLDNYAGGRQERQQHNDEVHGPPAQDTESSLCAKNTISASMTSYA